MGVLTRGLLGWMDLPMKQHKKDLLARAERADISRARLCLVLSRGFKVVLFLQNYNLRLCGGIVLKGALAGLFLSGLVATPLSPFLLASAAGFHATMSYR